MNKRELVERIQHSEYCAALEVTNGLHRFGDKVNEAVHSKRYVTTILNGAPATVENGVLFFRNAFAIDDTRDNVDYCLQFRSYDPALVEESFARARAHQRLKNQTELVDRLAAGIRNGITLEELFYPDPDSFPELATRLNNIPLTIGEYYGTICQVKGGVVEEYAGLLFSQLLPDATVVLRQQYRRKRTKADIDLILIDDRKTAQRVLSGDQHFSQH